MHPSAYRSCERFYKVYGKYFPANCKIIEIGSQDVNGSLRPIFKEHDYTGVDFAHGKGVDVVLRDPYKFPFPENHADVVVSSSCFEHSEMFWVTFLEILRILKPHGLFYLNAPTNGIYHRYPVDCWRFFPDSGNALAAWARQSGHDTILLESYVTAQNGDIWNDFVGIFLKSEKFLQNYPFRTIDERFEFFNGHKNGSETVLRQVAWHS